MHLTLLMRLVASVGPSAACPQCQAPIGPFRRRSARLTVHTSAGTVLSLEVSCHPDFEFIGQVRLGELADALDDFSGRPNVST